MILKLDTFPCEKYLKITCFMVDAHLKVTNLVFSMFYFRFHFIQSEGSSPAGADLQGALHLRTLITIDIEQSLC